MHNREQGLSSSLSSSVDWGAKTDEVGDAFVQTKLKASILQNTLSSSSNSEHSHSEHESSADSNILKNSLGQLRRSGEEKGNGNDQSYGRAFSDHRATPSPD